jgi:membrane protein YdbS with pleckstrin-like domain
LCRSLEECELSQKSEILDEEELEESIEQESSEEQIENSPRKRLSTIKIIFVLLLILIFAYIMYVNGSYILSSMTFFVQVIILICITLITLYVFSKAL